jgi:hypothetical protein
MKKEYDFSKLKELKKPYAGKKMAVGIDLSPEVVDYFKGLADETGLPYQKLIDLYLLDFLCSAGLSPELRGASSASREARHLSFLREEAQETHHEVAGVILVSAPARTQPIPSGPGAQSSCERAVAGSPEIWGTLDQ